MVLGSYSENRFPERMQLGVAFQFLSIKVFINKGRKPPLQDVMPSDCSQLSPPLGNTVQSSSCPIYHMQAIKNGAIFPFGGNSLRILHEVTGLGSN